MSAKKQKGTENQTDKVTSTEEQNMQQEAHEAADTPEQMEQELAAESADAENDLDALTAKYEEMQKKYDALHNDYLRLMADFDNYRKRTLREKSDLLKYGSEDALKKLLPVIDDFERALTALESSDDIKAVKDGVDLIYNKFRTYLDNNGVKEIPATGENFDTEVHEAITTFPAPTPEQKGKVIDCMTKGYKLNDKVIRFAKVVVGE